jgi:hypothetical protein
MSRTVELELAVVLALGQVANAAWLRMQWRGLEADEAEIELAPGEPAVIDIYFEMTRPEETLASLSFRNTDRSRIRQSGTEVLLPGWTDHSTDGPLGDATQFVEWTAAPGASVLGPGEYLVGSQTIHHIDQIVGHSLPITFAYDEMYLFDAEGDPYTFSHDLFFIPGFFGAGLGRPESPGVPAETWDPLFIITVPEPGTLLLLAIGAMAPLRGRAGYEIVRNKGLG